VAGSLKTFLRGGRGKGLDRLANAPIVRGSPDDLGAKKERAKFLSTKAWEKSKRSTKTRVPDSMREEADDVDYIESIIIEKATKREMFRGSPSNSSDWEEMDGSYIYLSMREDAQKGDEARKKNWEGSLDV